MEAMQPDVLVIPECEQFDSVTQSFGAKPIQSQEWIGDDPAKGLGVIAFGDYDLTIHPDYNPSHKWILPLKVYSPLPFTLFAIWTIPQPNSKESKYVRPLLDALESYAEILLTENVIWAGDFNANHCFDKNRPHKFSEFVERLGDLGLQSLYHRTKQCAHGAEKDKTFFMHHNELKGHHLDYIFADSALLSRGPTLEIGKHHDWSKLSDHVPLILDVP